MDFRLLALFILYVQIAAGIWMFARGLEPRSGGWLKIAAAVAIYLALFMGMGSAIGKENLEGGQSLIMQLAGFIAYLWLCLAVVLVKTESSFWTALFCATAGYTTQNLASGADGLVKLLALTWFGIDEYQPVLWFTSFIVCTLAVYVPVWALFSRRVDARALNGRPHRGMLGVIVVVMLVVILFDVVNKALPMFGVPLAVTCVSRAIHGVVCAFVLYAEYEMIFNQQLKTKVAVTERVLEERGSQYELSRETIAAVNRRVHDIRHQVMRELDGHGVDRETLAGVARAVAVYDANVRTGNEALDTVLTERRLLCQREGISLTCVADGTCLSRLPPAETYSLVGGILDEAVAAARGVADPGMRTISLSIRPVGGMASVHVETFAGEGWRRADRQGSAEDVVRRHDGVFSAAVEDGVLLLDAGFPMP